MSAEIEVNWTQKGVTRVILDDDEIQEAEDTGYDVTSAESLWDYLRDTYGSEQCDDVLIAGDVRSSYVRFDRASAVYSD